MPSTDEPADTTDLRTILAAKHLALESANAAYLEIRDARDACHREWTLALDAALNAGLTYSALGNDACYPRPTNL